MVNLRIISKIIGSLLFIEAFFMSWCAIISFSYDEDDQMAFLLSMLLTFGCGALFMLFGKNAENILSRRDAYLLVTAVWGRERPEPSRCVCGGNPYLGRILVLRHVSVPYPRLYSQCH